MKDFKKLFNVKKPVIGMAHFGALPGDPKFDPGKGLKKAVYDMEKDIEALQDGGIDGIMFSNENSQPWLLNNYAVTLNSMSYIIGRVKKQIRLPFGVHVIWDAMLTLDLAVATGASFAWEVFTGVYASDYGLWDNNPGCYMRHKQKIYGEKIKILCEIIPEASADIDNRMIFEKIKTILFNFPADTVCVAGLKPGIPPPVDLILQIKQASSNTGVIISTGVKNNNVKNYLNLADGVIVGSCLKKNGQLFNHVDSGRVKEFMSYARS